MISARVQEAMVTDIQTGFDKDDMTRFIYALCEELCPGGFQDRMSREYFLEDLTDCLKVALAEDETKKYWELDTALRDHFTDAYMKMHIERGSIWE